MKPTPLVRCSEWHEDVAYAFELKADLSNPEAVGHFCGKFPIYFSNVNISFENDSALLAIKADRKDPTALQR